MRYIILILFICSCSPIYLQPRNPGEDYRLKIELWQERIKTEGWSESLVNDVVDGCLRVSKYEKEPDGMDHWMTYKEFIEKGLRSDCEDVSTFIFGTLRRLNCPYDLWMRIIRMPAGDHVVVVVGDNVYNSLPMPGDFVDLALSRTVVQWNETEIVYPQ